MLLFILWKATYIKTLLCCWKYNTSDHGLWLATHILNLLYCWRYNASAHFPLITNIHSKPSLMLKMIKCNKTCPLNSNIHFLSSMMFWHLLWLATFWVFYACRDTKHQYTCPLSNIHSEFSMMLKIHCIMYGVQYTINQNTSSD